MGMKEFHKSYKPKRGLTPQRLRLLLSQTYIWLGWT